MTELLILMGAMLISTLLTGAIRTYALKRGLIDTLNFRSSHTVPTPRGGGAAIVVSVLMGLSILYFLGLIQSSVMWAYSGAGILVASIGFVDDHRHVPARWRLLSHFIAAFWLVYFLLPNVHFGITLISVVSLVWLLNLYNFMDGIDGIAGVEAITVCLGGIVLTHIINSPNINSLGPLLLLGSTTGFLFWNFPKAKVFMGDAGSGFVGIMVGAFAVNALNISIELFWAWVILLGCFVVDATVTLFRRMLRGRTFYKAHRGHAYQVASRKYGDHRPVTIAVAVINLVWLLPIAAMVVTMHINPLLAVAVAWAPLVAISFHYHAGVQEH